MTRARVPRLPVLLPSNRSEYPDWHAYFERVYGHVVSDTVNLNLFEFFYSSSPLGWHPTTACPRDGEAWVGYVPRTPEHEFRRIGFFVRRSPPPRLVDARSHYDVVEVTRTLYDSVVAPSHLYPGEEKLAWFFLARGTGMFVRVPRRRVVVDDRIDVREWWTSDVDDVAARNMDARGVSAVVFRRSVLRYNWFQLFLHERAEMAIRLVEADSSCAPRTLEFRTAWKGKRACRPEREARFLTRAGLIAECVRPLPKRDMHGPLAVHSIMCLALSIRARPSPLVCALLCCLACVVIVAGSRAALRARLAAESCPL